MSTKKIYHFFENVVSLFSIKGIELALTIWLIPFLILRVGLENYGIYVYAMALILLLQNVLNYGFNLSSVRDLAKNRDNKERVNAIFSEVLSVKLFLFVVITGLYVCLINTIPSYYLHKELYYFGIFILLGDVFSLRWFFLGMEEMKYKAIINFGSTVFYIVLVLFLIKNKDDYYLIPFAQGFSLLVVAFISFLIVVRKYSLRIQLISLHKVILYLKQHFSSFINLMVPSTFNILAIFLVGVFGSALQVSITQIGVKVANMFCTVNSILTVVFYPMVNRNTSVMYKSRIGLLFIGIILSGVMFVSSTFLIEIWMHNEPAESIQAIISNVKVLSPLPFLVAVISGYGINGLLTYLKDKVFSYITIFSALLMFLVSYYLTSTYIIIGGALTLLIGRFVYATVTYIAFKRLKYDV